MSHPSLGLPPPDLAAGFPDAAERLRAARARVGARALEIAVDGDPTMRERYDEAGLRLLLRDAETFIERIALCVAGDDPHFAREWADWMAPVYRRRRVPMDDLVSLARGLSRAVSTVLSPEERRPAEAGIEAAIKVFRSYRRIAGDARKRNRILAAIYKGA